MSKLIPPSSLRTLALYAGLLAFFAVFLLYPLLYVLFEAFFVDGRFSLFYFRILLTSRNQWQLLLGSINIALAVTAACTLIAVPLSLLCVRAEFFGRRLLQTVLLAPLLLPPFVGALGLQKLLGRFGVLNTVLLEAGMISFPLDFLGAGSVPGVIIMQTLHLYPLLVIMLSGALQSVDAGLEEAARTVGATARTRLFRITLPLALPGYLAGAVLVFVGSLTDLGTPLMFQYRRTVAVQIYQLLGEVGTNPYGYAVVVFVTALCSVLFFLAFSGFGAKVVHSGGRAQKTAARRQLGPAQTVTALGAGYLLASAALLPHLGVLLYALGTSWIMTPWPSGFTLDHFHEVFVHPLSSIGLFNSVVLSAASTALTAVVGVAAAYLMQRGAPRGRALLELLCLIPLAVPGIVVAFGYASAFSGTVLDNRYNPFPLLILAYTVRKMPFMVRAVSAGLQSASPAFEEAARTVGATRTRALLRITLPLISRQVLGGALLCFAFAMLEVSDSLLLALEERYFPISKALYALSLRPDGIPLACALAVISLAVTGICMLGARLLSGSSLEAMQSPAVDPGKGTGA